MIFTSLAAVAPLTLLQGEDTKPILEIFIEEYLDGVVIAVGLLSLISIALAAIWRRKPKGRLVRDIGMHSASLCATLFLCERVMIVHFKNEFRKTVQAQERVEQQLTGQNQVIAGLLLSQKGTLGFDRRLDQKVTETLAEQLLTPTEHYQDATLTYDFRLVPASEKMKEHVVTTITAQYEVATRAATAQFPIRSTTTGLSPGMEARFVELIFEDKTDRSKRAFSREILYGSTPAPSPLPASAGGIPNAKVLVEHNADGSFRLAKLDFTPTLVRDHEYWVSIKREIEAEPRDFNICWFRMLCHKVTINITWPDDQLQILEPLVLGSNTDLDVPQGGSWSQKFEGVLLPYQGIQLEWRPVHQ